MRANTSLHLAILLAFLPSARAQVCLESGPRILIGASTASSIVADLDGDSRNDLVFARATAVTIVRATGTDAYAPPLDLSAPGQPVDVVASDVDGDGRLDLIVAFAASANVGVLRNAGNFAFDPIVLWPSLSSSQRVMVADLDLDGDLDIATAGVNGLHVLVNSGGGQFGPATSYVAANSYGLAGGDIDADGDFDLLCTRYDTSSVSVFRNQGNATFAAPTTIGIGPNPVDIEAVDLEPDGDVDFVVCVLNQLQLSGAIGVLRNSGNGTFAVSSTSVPTSGLDMIEAGDMDGDGDADVVISRNGWPGFLFRGQGNSFDAGSYVSVASDARGLLAADVDADGDLDLLSVAGNTGLVNIQTNRGDATFGRANEEPLQVGPIALATADVDQDGRVDVLAINDISNSLSVLRNSSDAWPWGGRVDLATGTTPTGVAVGDWNADGWIDVAVCNRITNDVMVRINLGNGSFGAPAFYSTGAFTAPTGIVAADLDLDGDVDLATCNEGMHSVSVLRNQGNATFANPQQFTAGSLNSPRGLTGGDLDGDGDFDLVVEGFSFNRVIVLRNSGNAVFAAPVTYDTPGSLGAVAVGDLDQDGDLDLAAGTNLGLVVRFNDGTGAFGAPAQTNSPVTGLITAVRCNDVDGDGDQDVTAVNSVQSACIQFANQGVGAFTATIVASTGDDPRDVAWADLDSDGDLDGAVVNHGAGTLSLLRGCRTSGEPYCFGDGSGNACPCGNASPSGAAAGCLNSFGTAGALRANGSARLGDDRMILSATGVPSGSGMYFQGTASVNNGAGAVFGDGLRCAGGSVARIAVVFGGAPYPAPGDPSLSTRGGVSSPGLRYYQMWYRNAASFCTSSAWNLSNGLRVHWMP